MSNSVVTETDAVSSNSPPPPLCLALLMGLPASGKSTLAYKLVSEVNSTPNCPLFAVSLTYDDFIPAQLQAKIAIKCKATPQSSSLTKICRNKFTTCVRRLIGHCLRQEFEEEPSSSCPELEELYPGLDAHLEEKLSAVVLRLDSNSTENTRYLLILDDNHYYASMRMGFYTLAKGFGLGFCIIYCATTLELCLVRNSERTAPFPVPEDSILEMSLKLEPPNPLTVPADVYAVQIPGDQEINFHLLLQLLETASLIRIPPDVDKTQDKEKERRITSQNETHAADQILRKWITSQVSQLRDGEGKGEISRELNARRVSVLKQLKSGELALSRLEEVGGGDVGEEFKEQVIQLANSLSNL